MEWYYILLIVLGGLIVVAALAFLIIYLPSKSNKEKSLGEVKGLHSKITDTFGGVDNIETVNVNGSRLSLTLKDTTYINQETLKVMSEMGFGVVKTSKKITLVVGEMATHYYNQIVKQMDK